MKYGSVHIERVEIMEGVEGVEPATQTTICLCVSAATDEAEHHDECIFGDIVIQGRGLVQGGDWGRALAGIRVFWLHDGWS